MSPSCLNRLYRLIYTEYSIVRHSPYTLRTLATKYFIAKFNCLKLKVLYHVVLLVQLSQHVKKQNCQSSALPPSHNNSRLASDNTKPSDKILLPVISCGFGGDHTSGSLAGLSSYGIQYLGSRIHV